jgi:hypothetical protein
LITRDIPGELRIPIVGVGAGHSSVARAAMPATAVDENGKSSTGEDYVDHAATIRRLQPVMLSKPEPAAVELTSQGKLGLRVRGTVSLHDGPNGRRTGRRRGRDWWE